MKVVTVFGTRPEIIRLCIVIRELDRYCEHVLVHTGQNFDPDLSERFFQDLGIRQPDVHLGVSAPGFAHQTAEILSRGADMIEKVQPDRILVLGDTNSGLIAFVAARMGVPLYHMEAGNRCYDDRVPEEINRRIIDHSSSVLMPYTQRSKENLVREGIERERIFVIGNPINEVITAFTSQIDACDILSRWQLKPREYFLATLHRSENVDSADRLKLFCQSMSRVADTHALPLVFSVHPRTADKLERFRLQGDLSQRIVISKPLGFFEFVRLEKDSRCVLTDSGTVQEECAIFKVPNVTLRDVTERPETIEAGSNILSGAEPGRVLAAVRLVLSAGCDWDPPAEYMQKNVSRAVLKTVLGYNHAVHQRAFSCGA